MPSCDAVRWTDQLVCGKCSLKGGYNFTLNHCLPNAAFSFIPANISCLALKHLGDRLLASVDLYIIVCSERSKRWIKFNTYGKFNSVCGYFITFYYKYP
jgi:hypothetical protein